MRTIVSFLALSCLATLPGCTAEARDSYTPKHGGTRVELAAHGPMLEVVHDAKKGIVGIYVFDADQKVIELKTPPTCRIKDHAVTGTGAGTHWTFTDSKLEGHPHDVMLEVEIDGKKYSAGWHPPH